MARKKDISKATKPITNVTEPDLFAINKIKLYRNDRGVSQPDIDRDTEISIGKTGKVENPRNTSKYSVGDLNILGKYLNSRRIVSENATKEESSIDLHTFLPSKPCLSKHKVPKILIDDSKISGPLDAIRFLIDNGFMKDKCTTDRVLDECQRIFGRIFLRDSIRNSLDYFIKQEPLLEKYRQGKTVFYKEK